MYISNIYICGEDMVIIGKIQGEEDCSPFLYGNVGGRPSIIELNDDIKVEEKNFELRIKRKIFRNIEIIQDTEFKLFTSMEQRNSISLSEKLKGNRILWKCGMNRYVFELICGEKQETIVFSVKKRKEKFKLKEINITEKELDIKLDLNENSISEREQVKIYLRKRMTEKLWQFSDNQILIGEYQKGNIIKTDFYEKLSEDYKEPRWYDFIVEIAEDNMKAQYFIYPICADMMGKCIKHVELKKENNVYKMNTYISNGGNLSLKFDLEKNKKYQLEEIEVAERLRIKVNSDCENKFEYDEELKKIKFYKRTYADMKIYSDVVEGELKKCSDGYYEFVEKCGKFLVKHVKRGREHWDVYIEEKQELYPVYCDDRAKTQYFSAADGFAICFFKNKDKNLSIYTHEGVHDNLFKTKIAVLGTCFSRSVFKSDMYFNPDYKRFYECVYTQFHSSIISMSSKKVEGNIKIEELVRSQEAKKYLPTEFSKDFFERFEKSGAEYLLVDNYIDATRPLIVLGKNCYLTYNKYYENSNLIRKFADRKMILPGTEEYYELYEKYIQIFLENIKKYITEEHILLLVGRFSYKKINEKTKVVEAWKDGHIIQRNNMYWDKIDYLFQKAAPNARVIDMRNTQYVSDVD